MNHLSNEERRQLDYIYGINMIEEISAMTKLQQEHVYHLLTNALIHLEWIKDPTDHRTAIENITMEIVDTFYDNSKPPRKVISSGLRKKVFERDRYRCVGCGDWHNLAVDHIYPTSKGGSTELRNLQTMCKSCNSSKGAKVE